jgi:hypothetical protein
MGGINLTVGYFDNFDNDISNKFKKNPKFHVTWLLVDDDPLETMTI